MSKPKILLQFDPDEHASVFDAVVAVDSDVDRLLQYQSLQPEQVRDLVYGAMFTRGPKDLHNTAIFIGGSNVASGETLLTKVTNCFFGPMRVSVMLDANGANTTAAAAVLAAERHLTLRGAVATVLAATGPVGQRIVRLLAREGVTVRAVSRTLDRAEKVCQSIRTLVPAASLEPVVVQSPAQTARAISGASLLFAAGAAGVELLSAQDRTQCSTLQVAIDLNAVPPVGLSGIEPTDQDAERDGVHCYGALGVGGTKMKIHKAALKKLFTANNLVLDAEEIFAIGRELK